MSFNFFLPLLNPPFMRLFCCVCSESNYTVFRVGRVTFFPAYLIEFGLRQPQALINTLTMRRGKLPPAILLFSSKLLLGCNIAGGNFPLLIVLVLISACVCRRPSWTPKTQPGGSSAATWLSFWCSTRLDMPEKKWPAQRGKPCRTVFCVWGLGFDIGVMRTQINDLSLWFARTICSSPNYRICKWYNSSINT